MTIISIESKDQGIVLAEAELGEGVIKFEGSYYFDPATVNMDVLDITDREYVCPYKGVANWIDMATENGKTGKEVAWVYPEPVSGFEQIAGRIAFYGDDSFLTQVKRKRSAAA